MIIQKKRESTTKKKMCKTLELRQNWWPQCDRENALSKYKMIDSITNVFDTLQTNRLDNQIGNGLLSLHYFSGNWNGNHTIHEINYYFLNPEFKKKSLYINYPPRSKIIDAKVPFTIRQ
jgi:hypothetical protein